MPKLSMFCKMARTIWIGVAPVFAASLFAAAAQADPLIVGNNSGGASGQIQTYDFATGGNPVAFFVPTGASGNNGRGIAVLGNKVYYTELSGVFGPTDFIRVAPFNGGAGGADIVGVPPPPPLPNPRPGVGIQDLAVANGVLYALTGYQTHPPPQVFGLNPITGAVVSGPVTISAPARPDSDGFAVLPNGNFLINEGDASCAYDQYNPTTGALIPATTITISAIDCTGVSTNGTNLFFKTNDNGFTKTDLTGSVVATTSVAVNHVEDISLVTFGCSGQPGKPNCHGKCVSDFAQQFGGLDHAASALGYASVADLQNAVNSFCAFP
ncbi:MAG: hypothetical protein ACREDM_13540 [Methylocella sp.]